MKENKNKINKVIQYFDSLITTINLGFDISIPKWYLYQKKSNKLYDN